VSLRCVSFIWNLDRMKELWMTVGRVPVHTVPRKASILMANLQQIKACSKFYWVLVIIRREAPLKYLTHATLWPSLDQYIHKDNRRVSQSFV